MVKVPWPSSLAQRPADPERQHEDGNHRQRHEQRRGPQKALARLQRTRLQRRDLDVHLLVALLRDLLYERGELAEALIEEPLCRGILGRRGLGHGDADVLLQLADLLEREADVGAGLAVQLLARLAQEPVLGAKRLEELRVAEHVVQARGALEGGHLPEQRLAGTGVSDALEHDLLPGVGEVADLQDGDQNRDEQRHGHEGQADQHQSTQ